MNPTKAVIDASLDQEILALRKGLCEAVESLERMMWERGKVVAIADAVAIVVEQVTNMKALLALIEHQIASD